MQLRRVELTLANVKLRKSGEKSKTHVFEYKLVQNAGFASVVYDLQLLTELPMTKPVCTKMCFGMVESGCSIW